MSIKPSKDSYYSSESI